jgi:hypothetical protein
LGALISFSQSILRYRDTKWLLLLLLVVLSVQTVYYVRIQSLYPPYGLTTEHYYSPLAINFLEYRVYATGEPPDLLPISQRPPFYSIVLAGLYGVFGEDERVGLIINNIFLWLTVLLVYFLGKHIRRTVGLLAALFFALDPIIYITANKNQADILYVLLTTLFLLQVARYLARPGSIRILLLGSLLLALATFTRAVSVYLWIPTLLFLIGLHRWQTTVTSWRNIGVIVFAFWAIQATVIGGWMIRNYVTRGNPDFASEQSQLFNSFFGPLVVARANGIGYKESKASLALELLDDPEYASLDTGAKERYALRRGIGLVLDHPVAAVRVYLEHIPVLFVNYPLPSITLFFDETRRDEIHALLNSYRSGKTSRLDLTGYIDLFDTLRSNGLLIVAAHGALYKLFYTVLLVGIISGSVMLVFDKNNRPLGIWLILFIGYMIFASSFWPTARLRIPIMPAGTIVAAYALVRGWQPLTSRLHRFAKVRSNRVFFSRTKSGDD